MTYKYSSSLYDVCLSGHPEPLFPIWEEVSIIQRKSSQNFIFLLSICIFLKLLICLDARKTIFQTLLPTLLFITQVVLQ